MEVPRMPKRFFLDISAFLNVFLFLSRCMRIMREQCLQAVFPVPLALPENNADQ